MGVLYRWLESIWIDCLWNDYSITTIDGIDRIAPEDPTALDWEVATTHRRDHLRHEFYQGGGRFLMSLQNQKVKEGRSSLKVVVSESSSSKTGRYVLAPRSLDDLSVVASTLARSLAERQYLASILTESLPENPRLNLSKLLDAWQILRSIAALHVHSFESIENGASTHLWAPLVYLADLEQAVVRSLGIGLNEAKYLISRFTYHGNQGEELWAQPLVPIGKGVAVLPIGAIVGANLSRILDIWIRQCGFNLDSRGSLFEQFVRDELHAYIQESKYLKHVQTSKSALRISSAETTEEIDGVLIFNALVVVLEVKCFLEPADAMEMCNYREKINQATQQASRKAKFLKANADAFKKTVELVGLKCPQLPYFEPLVVLNGAIHAGISLNSVPVVDMPLLARYFDGGMSEVAELKDDGSFIEKTRRLFYDNAAEGEQKFVGYVNSPPQIQMRLDAMRSRELPIMPVKEGVRPAVQILRQCVVDYRARASREIEPNSSSKEVDSPRVGD